MPKYDIQLRWHAENSKLHNKGWTYIMCCALSRTRETERVVESTRTEHVSNTTRNDQVRSQYVIKINHQYKHPNSVFIIAKTQTTKKVYVLVATHIPQSLNMSEVYGLLQEHRLFLLFVF